MAVEGAERGAWQAKDGPRINVSVTKLADRARRFYVVECTGMLGATNIDTAVLSG